ncbi:MAG: transposase [Spirochaetaceae bacterium]|nr:transposase [Spirochaetaceae bacterium]
MSDSLEIIAESKDIIMDNFMEMRLPARLEPPKGAIRKVAPATGVAIGSVALIQVVQECWLNGVSTRKIDNIAKRLGIESLSASEVSEINSGLDQMVEEFRTRPNQYILYIWYRLRLHPPH